MFVDEVILKIISRITAEYMEIDTQKLRGMLEEVLSEYEIKPMSKALTTTSDIQEKIFLYLTSKKIDGLSKETIDNYKLHLVRFSTFIKKKTQDITSMDIRVFLATLEKVKKLKSTTLATEVSILKSFFSWLENEEYIDKSPMRKIKTPKTEKRLRKALNTEELEILRDACETPRQRALLEFLFSTGCRLSETVNINLSDINWVEKSLKVIGKGNKERKVFFSDKAKIYLRKYLKSRGDISCTALFTTERKPYHRLGNRGVEKEIKKIAMQADFDKSVYPHLLRHTMATLGLQSGASLTTIQTLLGHSDPATTEIYAEISNDTVKEEYQKHLIQ